LPSSLLNVSLPESRYYFVLNSQSPLLESLFVCGVDRPAGGNFPQALGCGEALPARVFLLPLAWG